ncbi:Serine/arginine-rich splicing factor SR45 [Penicillium chermesinum]|uniref:Serine/arginine-rich splicing factor SR45 n=1 Tax=Penicillium chermesinum TaxID=63820 RepID=A0A9W9TL23_9EURO|nr:Serine/arginine-rich splicing factor SR45 [Penicillium chermesinum]KAJ5225140.1 Serine/arginine-rich splicing factor SR45 [Penicillium chermesinum]KAJ6140455.1 Serine/arginine-rich splicing factor SR45 [Penicillium chermesinum]
MVPRSPRSSRGRSPSSHHDRGRSRSAHLKSPDSRSRSITRSPTPARERRSRSRTRSSSRGPARGSRRYRSRSYSRSLSRDPSPPRSSKIVVEKLTKNVTEGHLHEIFGSFGDIEYLDLPINRSFMTNRGTAYITYFDPADAEAAISHMHEAQLDGAVLNAGHGSERILMEIHLPDVKAVRDSMIDMMCTVPNRYQGPGLLYARVLIVAPAPHEGQALAKRARDNAAVGVLAMTVMVVEAIEAEVQTKLEVGINPPPAQFSSTLARKAFSGVGFLQAQKWMMSEEFPECILLRYLDYSMRNPPVLSIAAYPQNQHFRPCTC